MAILAQPSFIPPENYSSTANGCSLREILEFKNTHFVYSFEVEEFESKDRTSKFEYFIRRTLLFARIDLFSAE